MPVSRYTFYSLKHSIFGAVELMWESVGVANICHVPTCKKGWTQDSNRATAPWN